jgi:hypothetical protein
MASGRVFTPGGSDMECDWDDDTLASFSEDDTIFGPQGVYGWLANLWYRFIA